MKWSLLEFCWLLFAKACEEKKNTTRDNTKELQAEVPVSDTQEVHHSLKGR